MARNTAAGILCLTKRLVERIQHQGIPVLLLVIRFSL